MKCLAQAWLTAPAEVPVSEECNLSGRLVGGMTCHFFLKGMDFSGGSDDKASTIQETWVRSVG